MGEAQYKQILGRVVEAKTETHGVSLSVFKDNGYGFTDGDPLFYGTVKWDGCSNWHVVGNSWQLHFCSVKEAREFGMLLEEMYQWATELWGDPEMLNEH